MSDLTGIPLAELLIDQVENRADIAVCHKAIAVGVTEYSSGTVARRLEMDEWMQGVIDAEIRLRATPLPKTLIINSIPTRDGPITEIQAKCGSCSVLVKISTKDRQRANATLQSFLEAHAGHE